VECPPPSPSPPPPPPPLPPPPPPPPPPLPLPPPPHILHTLRVRVFIFYTPYAYSTTLHTTHSCSCGQRCAPFASRLEIEGHLGNQWGQNAHALPADAAADDEGAESALKRSPRARHYLEPPNLLTLTFSP